MVAAVTVAAHEAAHVVGHEVGLEEAHAEEVSTNHKDLDLLILITLRTTIMALKNETKSSETRKVRSLPNKRATRPMGEEAEVVSEDVAQIEVVVAQIEVAVAQTEAAVAQTEAVVVAAAAGIKTARSNRLYLTQRTVTSRWSSKTRQKALLPLANKPADKSKRCLILSKLCVSTTTS